LRSGTFSDRIFAPFWPPNIVLFCALILVPYRRWWVYIAAAFPAHVLAEVSLVGMPASQLLVAFVTNCMVATLNAYGVRKFLKDPPWFGTLRNASTYILITAAVSPAISALGGAFVLLLSKDSPPTTYWAAWLNWYLANALGSVTLGPAVMIWFHREAWTKRPRTRWIEAGLLALSLAIVCTLVFHTGGGTVESGFLPALLYSPIPLIVWAAIRFGQRGASGAILVVTIISVWQNLHAPSVFVASDLAGIDRERNVLALQIFLMGIAIPVFFLGSLIDELEKTGAAMKDLATNLLQAQDEERRRIARELHDSTGQNLVVADLLLDRIQASVPASSAPAIEDLHKILRQSMVEVRTLSYLLHPPLLDGMGLDIALNAYIDGFSKRTGITVDLEMPPDQGAISASVEVVLFRVIQEALTNVWRHSGSTTAQIRLIPDPSDVGRRLTLSIEDFGKGIPGDIRDSTLLPTKGRATMGLGLAGMRERLHQIGGILEIDSTAGSTVIRAIVPMNTTT
jgi:signal transduction histidine kinase